MKILDLVDKIRALLRPKVQRFVNYEAEARSLSASVSVSALTAVRVVVISDKDKMQVARATVDEKRDLSSVCALQEMPNALLTRFDFIVISHRASMLSSK